MNTEKSSFWDRPAVLQKNLRRLRAVVWLITICAGFLQAWASRFFLSPDALNYLDLSSAWLRGDWSHAVNAYWSPFFSWLLALCFGVFRLGPYWDSTVIHLLNFVALLLSLRAFEFFFRGFLRLQNRWRGGHETEDIFPELGWWVLGYALFLSTSLLVLSVINTTPDVWVAVFTYLAAGLVLRIAITGGRWQYFAILGLVLGCAFLTKAFYFPMSFVFLLTAWFATGNPRKTPRQASLGFLAFLLVTGPWVSVISRAKNRFTFGDVGKLAYAMMIDQVPRPALWQGENETGTPRHPVRQLLTKPRLFEFATPITGTYPPGYDWSYWLEGMRPRFHLKGQLRVLRQSVGTFFQIFLVQLEYAVAMLFLFFLTRSKRGRPLHLPPLAYLWLPALVACSSYAIVLVEFRYVAPFVLLLWLTTFSSLFPAACETPVRVMIALVLAVLLVTGLRIAKSAGSDFAAILSKQQNVDWEVAEGLRALGLQPHDRVSVVSQTGNIHWARVAGVTIVSEIPLGEEAVFWSMDAGGKDRVFQVLAETGARIVVTRDPPLCATKEGWVPLSKTGFYVYRLPVQNPRHP